MFLTHWYMKASLSKEDTVYMKASLSKVGTVYVKTSHSKEGTVYVKASLSKESTVFDVRADFMSRITSPEYFALLNV